MKTLSRLECLHNTDLVFLKIFLFTKKGCQTKDDNYPFLKTLFFHIIAKKPKQMTANKNHDLTTTSHPTPGTPLTFGTQTQDYN